MITIRARRWDDIRRYYLSFGEGARLAHHLPLLDLIAWLETEGSGEVFGSMGISGLYLSDRPRFTWCEHMLQVSVTPKPGFVAFEYHPAPGAFDYLKKEVPTYEALECLRQLLDGRFGIHRPATPGAIPLPVPAWSLASAE